MTYRAGLTPAQPHETTLAYVVPFVKRKMRKSKKSLPYTEPAAPIRLSFHQMGKGPQGRALSDS